MVGLLDDWRSCVEAEPVVLPDGSMKTFREGGVTMQLKCPRFSLLKYKWPEGSLRLMSRVTVN